VYFRRLVDQRSTELLAQLGCVGVPVLFHRVASCEGEDFLLGAGDCSCK
jgi:hypothetical protein